MSQLRVLVVGASIAGPMTAYWFAKAGAAVTVIERFPQLRTGGQNIDIRTAGVSVMRKVEGMEASVRAKTTEMSGMSFVDDHGRPYGIITSTGNPDQQSLVSEYEIFRGDLSGILFELTKGNKNIKYVFGEQVLSIRQNEKQDGPVTVEFANGYSTSQYDLVVACDGSTSRTRAKGLNCGVRDHIHTTNCWAAYFSIKQDILTGSKVAQAHSHPGGRFVAAGPDPLGVTRITLLALNPKDGSDATLPFREASEQGDEALKRYVVEHFKDVGWKTAEILKGMMESDDFYASEVVQVKVPTLHQGRFVLVGDAGHATGFTGAGTSLAMTAAYLLAGEVGCRHRGNLTSGLDGYEQQMAPIVKEMQWEPPLVKTFMAPQTAWGIAVRNYLFALVSWTGLINFAQKYLAPSFASNETYKLPEYDWTE